MPACAVSKAWQVHFSQSLTSMRRSWLFSWRSVEAVSAEAIREKSELTQTLWHYVHYIINWPCSLPIGSIRNHYKKAYDKTWSNKTATYDLATSQLYLKGTTLTSKILYSYCIHDCPYVLHSTCSNGTLVLLLPRQDCTVPVQFSFGVYFRSIEFLWH